METSTFILPAADEDLSELRSMCICFLLKSGSGVNALVVPYRVLHSDINCCYMNALCIIINNAKMFCMSVVMQGSGHSSSGGHPGSSAHPGLLVLQKEKWLQNNQGGTITQRKKASVFIFST